MHACTQSAISLSLFVSAKRRLILGTLSYFPLFHGCRRKHARSDPKFPAHGAGREVTRVVSTGTAQIDINIVTKDMRNFGYVEDDAGYNYTA